LEGYRRPEEEQTHNEWQMHSYDLNHTNSNSEDERAVKLRFKTRTQPTELFTQGVVAHHLTRTHKLLPTRTNTHACILTCVAC